MPNYSIVDCSEVHNSVKENYSLTDSPEFEVQLQCAFANRYTLIADLLGNRQPWPFFTPTLYTPRAATCLLQNLPGKPTQSGQSNTYDQSVITVTYNSKIVNLFSEELEPTAEFQELNASKFCWDNAFQTPLSQGEAPGFLRRGLILNKTFFQVPDPLNPALIAFVGCVNNAPVTNSMGLTFDTETLLYVPPNLSRTVSWGGTNAWQVGTKFIYKSSGWNKFWNSADQQFEHIRTKQTAFGNVPQVSQVYEPYTPVAFNGIFF